MSKNSLEIFEKLKKEVVKTFLEASNLKDFDVSKWGVNDIQQFQDHLMERTKGSVSEKWFYTYFKNETDKIPRIDMLNILSIYCGYNNWAEFKEKHEVKEGETNHKRGGSFFRIMMVTIGLILISVVLAVMFWEKEHEYQFCFIDDNTNNRITTPIEIIILQKDETPYYLKTIDKGCFTWKTKKEGIIAIVKSPYHLTDTIFRSIHSKGSENIKLKTDDYALMIHYYSTANVSDWKKRREHLRTAIHDKAIIYQVHPDGLGVELYSKDDFINKLTLPTSSLKNIEIIETNYEGNKIVGLKFKLTS